MPVFSAIQAHLSRNFHPAVDFLGLRRGGSRTRIINQARDFPEQASWRGNLGQLESNIAAMEAFVVGYDTGGFAAMRRLIRSLRLTEL